MVDFARITIAAGNGGNGSGSFFQNKGKRFGKANGGYGGDGGNVYLEATSNLNTLEPYRFVKDYKAENGQPGLGNLRRGANGQDLILKVPTGTVVKVGNFTADPNSQPKSQEPTGSDSKLDLDLVKDGQRVLVANGGRGGRGNSHMRDEYGRRPRSGETGQPGEEFNLTLELKIIAQVGLIGLPNAGKSTLLSALTAAHPQIANYPFTTLEPNLGVLDLGLHSESSKGVTLIIADIPGLIEGASQGKGLGINFLRHIERTTLLVHIIDVTSGDPWKDYLTIRNELKAFNPALNKKKEIIVLNKIDLISQDLLKETREIFTSHRKKTVAISASDKQGLEPLVKLLA
jgi:GTP-binding protein